MKQLQRLSSHLTNMRLGLFSLCLLTGLAACTPPHKQSPDELREQTARATASLKENAKAVTQGIREGLSRSDSATKTVDINSAGKSDLLTLPGITSSRADRIIAARPFDNTRQLVTRKILSADDYDGLKDRVVAK